MQNIKEKIISRYKRFRCWWRAHFLDYPYWRVTYPDGTRTRLFAFREANSLQKVIGGKVWIDYETCKNK